MIKYLSLGFIAVAFVLSGNTAHAEMRTNNGFGSGQFRMASTTATTTERVKFNKSSNVDVACVGTAVATREAALLAGVTARNTAVASAYSARATALATAFASSDLSSVRSGVSAAWSAFKSSMSSARSTWKTTQKDAWSAYKDSVKSCKAAKALGDSSGASLDANI